MKFFRYTTLILFVFLSCKNDKDTSNNENTQDIKPVVFEGIDSSIKPGDDFFNHVNKTWYDNAVIADDQVGVGAYRYLNIPQQKLLKNILDEVSKGDYEKESIEQKVGDFYASGMDTININKRGI